MKVTAVAVDKFTGQSNSSSLSINVYGPSAIPLSPVDGATIENPVSLSYQVCFLFTIYVISKKIIRFIVMF